MNNSNWNALPKPTLNVPEPKFDISIGTCGRGGSWPLHRQRIPAGIRATLISTWLAKMGHVHLRLRPFIHALATLLVKDLTGGDQ